MSKEASRVWRPAAGRATKRLPPPSNLGDEASALGLLDVIEENAARPEFKAEAESAEYLARARKLREEIRSGGRAGR